MFGLLDHCRDVLVGDVLLGNDLLSRGSCADLLGSWLVIAVFGE